MGHRLLRRWLLPLLAMAVVATLGACASTTRPTAPTASAQGAGGAPPPIVGGARGRPNVLVIETDDMRSDELRWMPNVRRFIADRGLTFENSFAPYPLCCPSRSSFLTGKYAHNHHVLSHVPPWGFHAFDDSDTLATRLQSGGYATALIGKYLNGYGKQPIHGTDKPSLEYVPPGWSAWFAGSDHLWRPGETYRGTPMHGSTYAYFDLTQNIDGRIRNFAGQYSTDVFAEQARSLMTLFGGEQRPWFLWFTPTAPHHGPPGEADDPAPSVRSDGGTTVWKTPARPDWVKGRFDAEITHGLGTPLTHSAEADNTDKPLWLRKLPELSEEEKAAETTVTRQRAEALFALDRQIGEMLRTLRDTGQYDRTVIAFTSDNGYYLGEHRKRQGKIELHEPSLRVPFLIAGPGIPQGRRYDPITTVDMAPTIAAMAGIGPMPNADGIDMTSVIEHGDRGWNRPVVTEGLMGEYPRSVRQTGFDSALNTRGIRLGRWKLTEYSTGESELYDLGSDPLELENLSGDPVYADVLAEMRELWLRYEDCAGKACAAALPQKWRTSVDRTKVITDHEARSVEQYYETRTGTQPSRSTSN